MSTMRPRGLVVIVALAAIVALAVVAPATGCGGRDFDTLWPDPPPGTETFGDLDRDHTSDDVDYPQTPPVGGDHDPGWQTCGVYREPIRDENAVHSLEHGAVWLAYDDSLTPEEVDALEALADGQSHVLVAPYPALADPVVATAWGHQLRVQRADDPRIGAFVVALQEGPQTPERGVQCSGGVGEPE